MKRDTKSRAAISITRHKKQTIEQQHNNNKPKIQI